MTGSQLSFETISQDLRATLSPAAKINPKLDWPRWSGYQSPAGHTSVKVTSASDVAAVIRYANVHSLPFLAQSGGSAPSITFDLGSSPTSGIIIDLSALQTIDFAPDRQSVRVGGGVKTEALVPEAYKHDVRVSAPSCNCVGIGGILGGALSRTAGLYGWGVQNIQSLEVVLADSTILEVDNKSHPDLFWGLRGAAPCLGIVTALTLKTFPVPKEENLAFQGTLIIDTQHLQQVLDEITRITSSDPAAECHLLISNSGAPDYHTVLVAVPFYVTTDESRAREVFGPLIEISMMQMELGLTPYDKWNAPNDPICTPGRDWTFHSASLARLDYTSWSKAVDRYTRLVKEAEGYKIGPTCVLGENYNFSMVLKLEAENPTSFGAFDLPSHVVVLGTWDDPSVKDLVIQWGRDTRDILRQGDGLNGKHANYANFCHGDEPPEYIWRGGQKRLKEIKEKYDPQNRFNQWFSP